MVMRNVGGATARVGSRYSGLSSFTAFANSRIFPSSMCIVPSGPHTPISERSISAMSQPYQLRDELAVPGGVAEGHLGALGTLEVDVHVVLPREADAAVDLDALAGGVPVGVRDVGLGHGRGE